MIVKNSEWQQTQERLRQLEKSNADLLKNNERLIEMGFRKAAQQARKKAEASDNVLLRNQIAHMRQIDFLETAISLISWEKLPDSPYDFFHSKRIERMISDYGAICIFKGKYLGVDNWFALPFVGKAGTLNAYGDYTIVTPYIPSAMYGIKESAAGAQPFGDLTVNKDCIIVTDLYEYKQTNGNASLFTIRTAIDIYSYLIADCEVAKITNRNWLKIPFLFNSKGVKKQDFEAMLMDIKKIVQGAKDNDDAIVTDYAEAFEILQTGVQYFGKEFQEAIIDYENTLFEYLGIAHNQNEKKAQQVEAEIIKNRDQYNIRIIRRLQNRQIGIDAAKKIWSEWRDVELKCNLFDYQTADYELKNILDGVEPEENNKNEFAKSNA